MKKIIALAALVFASSVQAQAWPTKPVRVIVNVAPGGVADVTARVLGARLQETLGQAFPVENRAGGDGYIGFAAVARSDPDGHTLLYSPGSSMMIAPHIVNRPDLDPLKVLAPVAATGACRSTCSHPERPFKNLGVPRLCARQSWQAQLRHAGQRHLAAHRHRGLRPRGEGEAEPRPLQGRARRSRTCSAGRSTSCSIRASASRRRKAGKLRMIAIAGPSRHPEFPDVPTLEENGIKGVDGGPHFGFYAPTGTPREAIMKINSEIQKAMQDPTVSARFKALAVDVAEPMTPEQFAAYVRGEHARYAKLIPELGIKP